jgi:TolB-like protein
MSVPPPLRPTGPLRAFLLVALAAGTAACARTTTGAAPSAARARLAAADSAARAAIANERAIDVATLPVRAVGVAPFAADPRDTIATALAYGLADLLLTDLSRSRQLTIVDRVRSDAVLRELRMAESGRVDSTTAPRVGRLVGARRLVVGTVASRPLGRFDVAARIADAATGQVSAGATSAAPLERVLDAEKTLALDIFDALQVNLTPAERAAVERRPTRSIAALLAYGKAVREEAFGRWEAAGDLYRQAAAADPQFAAPLARLQTLGVVAPAGSASAGGAGGGGRAGSSSLARAGALAADGVNAPIPSRVSEVADPSFLSAAQAVTTIIIVVRVP